MNQISETVDHGTLQRMSAAGVVTDAILIAEAQGWAVVAQIRQARYALAARRGNVRHWSRMESAARYLRKLGIVKFRVNARELDAAAVAKGARPDSSVKLKAARDAASYDAWFREQVAAAIKQADSADAVWCSQEEVEAEFAERRAESQRWMEADE